jgi:hypothetical protein
MDCNSTYIGWAYDTLARVDSGPDIDTKIRARMGARRNHAQPRTATTLSTHTNPLGRIAKIRKLSESLASSHQCPSSKQVGNYLRVVAIRFREGRRLTNR